MKLPDLIEQAGDRSDQFIENLPLLYALIVGSGVVPPLSKKQITYNGGEQRYIF